MRSHTEYMFISMNFEADSVLEILSKLADFYNTSVDYLIFRTSIEKPYPKQK